MIRLGKISSVWVQIFTANNSIYALNPAYGHPGPTPVLISIRISVTVVMVAIAMG